MVGEASRRMQKADCRDEIALPAAMLAWLKYRKQRTRNSRKRFLVFFCSLFVKARVVYRLRLPVTASALMLIHNFIDVQNPPDHDGWEGSFLLKDNVILYLLSLFSC